MSDKTISLEDPSNLMLGVRKGDAAAMEQVFRLYFSDLVDYACRKLRNKNGVFDGEEAAASAMRTFIRRAGDGQFVQLANQLDLFKLLSYIVLRKAIKHQRKTNRFVALSTVLSDDSSQTNILDRHRVTGPVAEQLAIVHETISNILDSLRDPLLKNIVLLQLEGLGNPEIAEKLGISTRTVQRHVKTISRIVRSVEEFEASDGAV